MKIGDAIKLAMQFSSAVSNPLLCQIDPYDIGENARYLDIGNEYGIRILTRYLKWDREKATDLTKKLVRGYPHHGFVLDVDELKSLGLAARYAEDQEMVIVEEMRGFLSNYENN